jgi:hypothetical protein
MEKLMEKLKALINEMFEDDIDEEEKVVIREDAPKRMKDRPVGDQPVGDQPSLGGRALIMFELLLSVLIAIPVFCVIPITGKLQYHTGDNLFIEHLIGLGLIAMSIFFLFHILKQYMYVGLLSIILVYALNQNEFDSFEAFMDKVAQDYITASAKVIQADFSFRSIETLKKKNGNPKYFKKVLNSEISSKSRNFAAKASAQYFRSQDLYDRYGDVVRYLSLYKYLNENFSYVPDPLYRNYYSTAEETIDNGLAGDCDEWSGLVYTSVKAIGGRARLIRVSRHIYPEVLVGSIDDFELKVIPLLDSLWESEYALGYFHHVDKQDNVWLSFDFGDYYHYSDIEEVIY